MEQELKEARDKGLLMMSAYENIEIWLGSNFLPRWAVESINELIEKKAWSELNDRFFRNLHFGTGGMRSRTLGKIITAAEQGDSEKAEYAHAAVGTNMLNDFNIIRSTIGLFRYCSKNLEKNEIPRIVIAHDVRYFSRHFCLLTASTWKRLGGETYIFDGPRSTPQLSFSVRYLKATAGVVITASHNPPFDNGYKVYYKDGGQIVSPHAEGIIKAVDTVNFGEIDEHLTIEEKGIDVLGNSADEAYISVVLNTILDAEVIKRQRPKIVYTPLHGTGQVIAIPAMKRSGVDLIVVSEQMSMDPAFPTVESPNPENGEALLMAIHKANEVGADAVLATDPDGDRMGAAVRGRDGDMVLLNGNIIGPLLAEYRITKIKEM
ncbi:MAG: phospho-sugar mutase, partial [Verrucomicrobia bacterium]